MFSHDGGAMERKPLLQEGSQEGSPIPRCRRSFTLGRIVAALLAIFFVVGTSVSLCLYHSKREGGYKDPHKAALAILSRYPLIDAHIDLPWLVRDLFRNNASAVLLEDTFPGHVDIPRLRAGHVGGFFWSVYTPCPGEASILRTNDDFITPTNSVRDTLEQIDIAHALIEKYPKTFALATNTIDIRKAIAQGKIASLLGIEGGHQLGNSIAALRQFHTLGVRYVTLTHSCHNVFADSAGILEGLDPFHNGLSLFGESLVHEMNRLGVIVDISHTSDATAIHVLNVSKAPVIWSHSSARSVWDVPRNVPDTILTMIGTGPDKRDAVVHVNFAPYFVAAPGKADVKAVADHIDWIGNVAGRQHVGIGSDYDGIGETPRGLEDVSSYPNLFAELYKRGWTAHELRGLAGENFLRVFAGVEATAFEMRNEPRVEDIYGERKDL